MSIYRKLRAAGRKVLDEVMILDHNKDAQTKDPEFTSPPWDPLALEETDGIVCNVCRWRGAAFDGTEHVELSLCPNCGANGRDRFLHWCLTERVELEPTLRMLECSPRMGQAYRQAMTTWFHYTTSDFDQRAHKGNLHLDLQDIDLPSSSLDVVLCAHVLEHVPETDKALDELHRVLAPGGYLFLQVPVQQAKTAPPAEPEFHGDNTPVYWRFGFDFTERLRETGFATNLLCTEEWADAVRSGTSSWKEWSGEFDLPDMLDHAIVDDLSVVTNRSQATQLGILPAYQYLTWECRLAT